MSYHGKYFFRTNKKKLLLFAFLFVMMFMGIGYSLLEQFLTINGTTLITKDVWSVHFVNNSIDDSSSSITGCSDLSNCLNINKRATIVDSLSVDFDIKLNNEDDYYEFYVDIINDGDIDAMLYNVVKDGIDSSNNQYYGLDVTYSDGSEIEQYDLLPVGVTDTIKVKLLAKSDNIQDMANFKVNIGYVNSDNNNQLRRVQVNLDPNGGSSSSQVKMVTVGEEYGSLPTPTRNGYTFVGWGHTIPLLNNTDTLVGYNYGGTLDTDNTYNGAYSVKTEYAWSGIYINLKSLYDSGKISVGDTLTYSVYVKPNFSVEGAFYFHLYRFYSTEPAVIMNSEIMPPNQWTKISKTFVVDSTSIASTNARLEADYFDSSDPYYFGNNRSNCLWFSSPQIEINGGSLEYDNPIVGVDSVVEETENHTLYAIWRYNPVVTFDANGGTVSESTREVLVGGSYGILPVPTRSGYTFKGWRGSNLLNLADRTVQSFGEDGNSGLRTISENAIYRGVTTSNYYYDITIPSYTIDNYTNNIVTVNDSSWTIGYGLGFSVRVSPNTTYTISNAYNSEVTPRVSLYSENGTYNSNPPYIPTGTHSYTFTTGANDYWLIYIVGSSDSSQVGSSYTDQYIKLEQGSIATEYEPYYIVDNATVIQSVDHTLTAIWEEDT